MNNKLFSFTLISLLLIGIVSASYNPLFKSDGDFVGIGTTSPSATLDVNGTLQLGGGKIRFNDTTSGYESYNGSIWKAMAGSNVPSGAIVAFDSATCPTGWILADGTSGTPDLSKLDLTQKNVSRMSATRAIAQTIATATYTKVIFDTENFDNLGEYNTTTGRFTATKAGYYEVSGSVTSTGVAWTAGEIWIAGIYKNSSANVWGFRNTAESITSVYRQSQVKNIVYLAAGDYLEIYVYHNQGASVDTHIAAQYNYFSVDYLGISPDTGLTYCMKTTEDSETSNTILGESGDSVFVQNVSKNVGIGTTSPTQKLHVEGDVNITGSLYVNYSSIYIGKGKISFNESSNSFMFYNKSGSNKISTVNTVTSSPIGSIIMYGGSSAPAGWIFLNGVAVSRITYSDLFAVIGTTYGAGDGSTTFNVPDFTDRFARGSTAGSTGGSDDAIVVSHGHTFTGNALGTHRHSTVMGSHNHIGGSLLDIRGTNLYGAYAAGTKTGYYFFSSSAGSTESPYTSSTDLGTKYSNYISAGTPTGSISTVGSSGVNANIPAYLGVNYIIKYE